MKLNKKGFSLVELLAVIGILAVLGGVLVPVLSASSGNTDQKVDEAAVTQLKSNIQMALQHSSMYKDAKDLTKDTRDQRLVVIYAVHDNKLILDRCEIIHEDEGKVSSYDSEEIGVELNELRSDIIDFINGKMEVIELQSEEYADDGYYFSATFPDVDYKVNVELCVNRFEVVTNSSLASPGLYDGARKDGDLWIFPPNGRIHLHTGYNGLANSEKGDVWKVTMTGTNLSKFLVRHSYYKDGQGWVGGVGTYSNVKNTDTMFEFYFTAEEDWPRIGFMIHNGDNEEAVVHNIQFTKVK